MDIRDARPGDRLSAAGVRELARRVDAASPAAGFGGGWASSRTTAGGFAGVRDDRLDWFPARVVAAVTGGFTFVEVWTNAAGTVEDHPVGRSNTSSDPAVNLFGASPVAGDRVLVRRGPATAGVWWEIAPRQAVAAVSAQTATGSGDVSLAANGTWYDVPFATLTTAAAGDYLVSAGTSAFAAVGSMPASPTSPTLAGRILVNGVSVTNSRFLTVPSATLTTVGWYTASVWVPSVGSGVVVKVQARRENFVGGVGDLASAGTTGGTSYVHAVKLT